MCVFLLQSFCVFLFWPQQVLCCLIRLPCVCYDSGKDDGDDEDDEHDEAPLYSAVVRFLTKFVSRLRRGDFRYTKICSMHFTINYLFAPPAGRF